MSKKERIEDLGKLSVLLNEMFTDEFFDEIFWNRAKYAWESFSELNEERKEVCIMKLAYGIERIREKIAECCCVADGDDE